MFFHPVLQALPQFNVMHYMNLPRGVTNNEILNAAVFNGLDISTCFETESNQIVNRNSNRNRSIPGVCVKTEKDDGSYKKHNKVGFSIDDILKPEFGHKESGSRQFKHHTDHKIKTEVSQLQEAVSRKEENRHDDESVWPAWVYCTRYSDRPSSGPRARRLRRFERNMKRPRTAFTAEQLVILKKEFDDNHYLNEERRQRLATQLCLNECQIKIWFQNRRAKAKKQSGMRKGLALQLMAQGLYNHSSTSKTQESKDNLTAATSVEAENKEEEECL